MKRVDSITVPALSDMAEQMYSEPVKAADIERELLGVDAEMYVNEE